MTNKKKRKVKKEKKEPEYRTKEERQSEVKHILEQLSEFHLNPTYDPVKKLYLKFKEYILNQDDKKYDPSYFNFSHMNRYGSEIFTKAWLEKNYSLFKIENK